MPIAPQLIQSVVFHVLVVACFMIGLPHFSRPLELEQPLLTVEIVQTLEVTNLEEGIKAAAQAETESSSRPKPPPPPPPPPPPQQQPPSLPAPPSPPPPAAKPVQAAEPLPTRTPTEKPKPMAAQPVVTPKPKPQQASVPIPAPAPKPAPKPVANTAPVPPAKPKRNAAEEAQRRLQQTLLTSQLQNLAATSAARKQAEKKEEDRRKAEQELTAMLNQKAGQAMKTQPKNLGPISISEKNRVAAHIGRCWSPPAGAAGADTLIVDIFIRSDRQGNVLEARIEDRTRFSTDRIFRAAANAARRAVLDCSPLPWPTDKFERWEKTIFEFDPRFITRG